MDINILLSNKHIKPKEKTTAISKLILDNVITIDQLIDFAKSVRGCFGIKHLFC